MGLDHPRLELQMVGSHHVGARAQTQVLCSSGEVSLLLSHLSRSLLSCLLRVSHSTYLTSLSGQQACSPI